LDLELRPSFASAAAEATNKKLTARYDDDGLIILFRVGIRPITTGP